jgi:hypothetical protein
MGGIARSPLQSRILDFGTFYHGYDDDAFYYGVGGSDLSALSL